MARKKNVPAAQENAELATVNEQEVQAEELTHEQKLSMASEKVVRAREDSLRRIEERVKSLEESELEAKQRSEEMKKSRAEAEKQAKLVVERKLAEFSYAENYRKKLLKDKEKNISASKARELQRKADAQEKARLESERQIAELLEGERREAEERRARTEAMLEKAANAKKKAEEAPVIESAPVEEVAPAVESAPPVEQPAVAAVAEKPTAAEVAMPEDKKEEAPAWQTPESMKLDFDARLGKDGRVVGALKDEKDSDSDDMVFRLPEMKLGASADASAAKKKEETQAQLADTVPQYPNELSDQFANSYSDALNSFLGALQNQAAPKTSAPAPAPAAVSDSNNADISELAAVLALHDQELRLIREERERILAERNKGAASPVAAVAAIPTAPIAQDVTTAAVQAEATQASPAVVATAPEQITADAQPVAEPEQTEAADVAQDDKINVVEEPQPIYDEEAIKKDIENMNRRSLKAYLEKCEKRLEKLKTSVKRAEKKLSRADEYERLERVLIALGVYKDVIDLLCENLKCCTLFSVKKYYASYQKRINKNVARYNALVDEYTEMTGNTLTKPEANIAQQIIDGGVYTPLPIISYTRQTIAVLPENAATDESGAKVAKKITLSEKKLHKNLLRAIKKKEACATVSQRAVMLAECITVERDIVELLAARMREDVAKNKSGAVKNDQKKLSLAITEYNSFVDEYELLSGTALVKASESIPEDIAAGKEYQPLPEIAYNRQRELLDKSAKDLAKEKKAANAAVRKGEAMPDKEEQLAGYVSANDKKVAEIAKLARKCEKAKKKQNGEAYNRAILNVAMLRGKIVALHRDSLVAAYRLDSQKYVDACKSELAHSVQLYNDEIARYNDATGIKLIMVSPGIAEDIVNGRSYQSVPTLEWRERFAELADGENADEKKVFVFPTLAQISKEQTLSGDAYVQSASFGENELRDDKLVVTPVNTAKYFKRFTVNKKSKIRAYEKRVKKAELELRHEIARTDKQIEQATDFGKVRFTVKKLVLNRDIVNLKIKGLEYSVKFNDKKRIAAYKNAVISAMINYNACVDSYEQLTGEKLTPASAYVPYDVIDGREHTRLPIIVYRKEFIETNGDAVRVVATLVKQNDEYKASLAEQNEVITAVPIPTVYPAVNAVVGKPLTKAEEKRVKRKEKKHGKSKEMSGASDTDESAQRTASNDPAILAAQSTSAVTAAQKLPETDEEAQANAAQADPAVNAACADGAALTYVYLPNNAPIQSATPFNVDAWNSASTAQYGAELAQNAAAEAKNRADISEYYRKIAMFEAANSYNHAAISEYNRDKANASAIGADNSARMATYYAASAEDSYKRSEHLAMQAQAFEDETRQNATRIQGIAQRASEASSLADVAMLSVYDGADRKVGLAVATAMTPSMRATVTRPLDERGLKRYCEKLSKDERRLESEIAALTRTSGRVSGNDKIVAVLDAIIACKARFDILVDILKQSVKSKNEKFIKHYRAKLTDCIKTYNALVDRYAMVSGNVLTKIDADKSRAGVVESILKGEGYEPVPDVTYDRDFRTPGDEKVVMLRPGVVVDDAVSTNNFADNTRLIENANHQIAIDIDTIAKSVEYEIEMVERSENVTQRYRYGISGDKSYKNAKKRITELKNDSIKEFEHERRDNERYYSVVYANPMTVSISASGLKRIVGRGSDKSRLEKEHDAKSVMRAREDLARIRSNVIELLDQRHKVNAELIALYTGSDVDPHGLPVSEEYQKKRMHAARRAHRRLKGRAKTVKQLSYIGDGTKGHIYELMNKKIVAESNLELFKYRIKREKHSSKGKRILAKDIKATKRTIARLERDIKGFLRGAVHRQREKATVIWGYTAIIILILFGIGALTIGVIFKEQLASWFTSFKAFLS